MSALQTSSLANQDAINRARLTQYGTQAGLFGQSLGLTAGAGQFGAAAHMGTIQDYWDQKAREKAAKDSAWSQAIGGIANLGAQYIPGRKAAKAAQ